MAWYPQLVAGQSPGLSRMAINDVVATHAGHAKRREKLIANGMELYELRPYAGTVRQRVVAGESKAGGIAHQGDRIRPRSGV